MSAPVARGGAPRLRAARAGDIARVTEIEREAFTDPWSAASFRALINDARVLFQVADLGGEVVGYSVVWTAADEAELANLAVARPLRGTGLGAALLDAVMEAARARGAVVMFLEVREANVAAQRLYASRGFSMVGRRRRYYRQPVEDALVLRGDLVGPRG